MLRYTLLLLVCAALAGAPALAQPSAAPKKNTAPPGGKPAAPAAAPAATGTATGKAPAGGSAAEQAVRKASQEYVKALNAGDFKTAAALWTADGVYVDPNGRSMQAQKVVAEELAKRFAGPKKPQLTLDVKSVRALTSDSVLEDGIVDVQSPDGAPLPRGRFSTVWVRQQGKWLIKSVHEPSPSALTHYYALSQLGWLVGNWTAEAEGNTIHIQCAWTPGRSFLLREISVERDGRLRHSVTQRIGLDPMSPKIKSWSFDADGGMAEAFWDKSSDSWHVYSRGASRDGQVTSARNVYQDITRDSYTLESGEAHAGSQNMPGFKLKFTRAAAPDSLEPASQTAGGSTSAGQATSPEPAVPASSAAGETDSLAKERILSSPEWRQTQQSYNEWLSVQKIYTPAEVKQLKAATAAKVAKMSAAQLQDFLEDSKEKVAILLSKDAEDARLWLAQRMAVEVKMTPEQVKEMRPDIANMTAAQVEERLLKIDQERKQTKEAQQAFNQQREFRIKAIDEEQKEAESEREQALDRSAEGFGYGGYGGYYGGGGFGPPGGFYGGYRW